MCRERRDERARPLQREELLALPELEDCVRHVEREHKALYERGPRLLGEELEYLGGREGDEL